MRQSHLFTKTQKTAPKDEVAKNAQLLIRAGFVHKEMAGVYAYLPLGLRVLERIKAVVREEMDAIGAQELIMTTLQRKDLWERTDRWGDEQVDIWFKSSLKAGGEVGLAWSHEEPIGEMMRAHLSSYKDLPKTVYQFQTKLRNELRAKSGIMRGREFVMKDAYSFAVGEDDHTRIYDGMKVAYMNVFKRLGIGSDTYITFASGGAFTQFSHEFQTVCEAGEDICYVSRAKGIAVNQEVLNDEALKELGVSRDELEEVKTAEVGNIFNFGRQKAHDIGLTFKDESGASIPVWMGSYGIGVTRLMGVLAEKFGTEDAMLWPESVSPFDAHLVSLAGGNEDIAGEADRMYELLTENCITVLYDDRDLRAGEKFKDADLIGIPRRLVVSEKTVAAGSVEYTHRGSGASQLVPESVLIERLTRP
jgi:prolyl-tRNA synthetase